MAEVLVQDMLMEQVGRGLIPNQNVVTGVTAAKQGTVVVTTTSHIFKLQVNDTWDVGVAWPESFRLAVQEILKVHRRQELTVRTAGRPMRLGDMPPDVIRLIIRKSAGERVDWLEQDCDTGCTGDTPELCGLTRRQCFSSFFLNALQIPINSASGLLCP